jgi:hypothetical protein
MQDVAQEMYGQMRDNIRLPLIAITAHPTLDHRSWYAASGCILLQPLISSTANLCGTYEYPANHIADLSVVQQLEQGTLMYSVSNRSGLHLRFRLFVLHAAKSDDATLYRRCTAQSPAAASP